MFKRIANFYRLIVAIIHFGTASFWILCGIFFTYQERWVGPIKLEELKQIKAETIEIQGTIDTTYREINMKALGLGVTCYHTYEYEVGDQIFSGEYDRKKTDSIPQNPFFIRYLPTHPAQHYYDLEEQISDLEDQVPIRHLLIGFLILGTIAWVQVYLGKQSFQEWRENRQMNIRR